MDGLTTYLSVFLVGLGLNLTPCVYPMLSVTVSIFSKNKTQNTFQSFIRSLVYVLGMCTTYSVLGTVVSLTGALFGQWLQNTWVLLFIAALITLLALSMFGVYRFEVPTKWVSNIGGGRTSGFIGLYLSGLFVGVFAAPCIGPPVAALLTIVASKQDPFFGWFIFFILSLGLGLPYLFLGTFSHLMHRLPKSGVWLIWIERLFGVILLSFAAYYYIIAVNPRVLPWLIPGALIFGGFYLGFVEKSGHDQKKFLRIKRSFGVIAIVFALFLIPETNDSRVEWSWYTPDRFSEATASSKPIVVDFYADWCIPCHEMDNTTYRHPRVVELMDRFERIKVDLTNSESHDAQNFAEELQILGIPTMVFYNSTGERLPQHRTVGYISAPDLIPILENISSQ